VQGTVVVLENKTGRVLAMTGGFSYPQSQLNRATQAVRQPGSAIKPLSYLAALGKGLQPNTLISISAERAARFKCLLRKWGHCASWGLFGQSRVYPWAGWMRPA
jgi:membrane carboxypeptidase/penicillin-binding protein